MHKPLSKRFWKKLSRLIGQSRVNHWRRILKRRRAHALTSRPTGNNESKGETNETKQENTTVILQEQPRTSTKGTK